RTLMEPTSRCLLLFSILFTSCHAPASGRDASSQATKAAPTSAAKTEKFGILAPLDPRPLALWPEAHGGSWIVLEVLPHGSSVKQGDVIARCETRAIDDELHKAELELTSAEV